MYQKHRTSRDHKKDSKTQTQGQNHPSPKEVINQELGRTWPRDLHTAAFGMQEEEDHIPAALTKAPQCFLGLTDFPATQRENRNHT